MRNSIFIISAFILAISNIPHPLQAQTADQKVLKIMKTNEPVIVDGADDEKAWAGAIKTDCFINKWPVDTGAAPLQTEVKLLYDDKYLYVFAKLHVKNSGSWLSNP
ncbi:DOMON domain-containing protein [Mucilaginibacter ginsenosidivorans]|uniref:Carbohydrate-binding domain-containing protein n=1 Tax=Mucilaginibacter ginsenosidivorans TaxID=398053 RepID=A0A5B8V3Q6_9SPHI|nr:hypothetical protein [Mucilaginibacter ginsenosidivorans]QEC65206.1 hypothetical protein FRZ54_22405 [Mucilaginibacter ginsenosidivorans]